MYKSLPQRAMHKREDGFVVVDEDVCIGCATATWLVRTARHSTMLKKGNDEVRWLLFARRRGETTHMCESCPLRALEFGPIEELRQKQALWLPSRHYRARISQNPISYQT